MSISLTFFSNYFNHHQEALCNAFRERLGDNFRFVETQPMEEFRAKMGWQRESPSYVLKTHLSEENRKKAFELAEHSDVVIMGTAPEEFIERRLEEDRLTFRYSERPLKEGRVKVLIPRLALKFYRNHYKNRDKKLYLLAAGAYCADDYRFLRSYEDKCLKFGYFPQAEEKSFDELVRLKGRNKTVRILWAGRFLRLKRADLMLYAARKCAEKGYDFQLEFVGDGEEGRAIEALSRNLNLSGRVAFKGYLSPEETRRRMEKANIFCMTSNHLEGWGSVIYEALSAGCAVVASHAAGAAPFLIDQGRTGYIFKSGSVDSLADKLEILLKNRDLTVELGRSAYRNMQQLWNPAVASERLIRYSEALLSGAAISYAKGPLSKCECLNIHWFREK